MQQTDTRVLKSGDGDFGWLGGLGVRFMVPGSDSNARFSLVEHPMRPRALAAPLHRHSREDEYSIVLSGRVGALLGDDVVFGGPGDVIWKPRGQWHTFWNAADGPASLLEIISPAGFAQYFVELIRLFEDGKPQPEKIGPIAARYGLEIDPSTIPTLCQRFGVEFA